MRCAPVNAAAGATLRINDWRPWVIFSLGLALHLAITLNNPIVWGGDTVIRLYDRYSLFQAHCEP